MNFISIIVEDKPGVIATISTLLAKHNINIEYLNTEKTKDNGVITVGVDKQDDALTVLKNAGLQAFSKDIILISLENKPGILSKTALKLQSAGVEMRSIRIVKRFEDHSVVAIDAEKNEKTLELVKESLIA